MISPTQKYHSILLAMFRVLTNKDGKHGEHGYSPSDAVEIIAESTIPAEPSPQEKLWIEVAKARIEAELASVEARETPAKPGPPPATKGAP
jgi:hypothetical protein